MATRSEITRRLELVDRHLQELKVEFERFFNGAERVPPEELRNRVQHELRRLQTEGQKTAREQFRLAGLEARFNSYNELFNRRMRTHEEGRSAYKAPAAIGSYDVSRGVVLGDFPKRQEVSALYNELRKSHGGSPRFDLDQFHSYVERQVGAIQAKTGCSKVLFRLFNEDGKMKLKAKPVQTTAKGD